MLSEAKIGELEVAVETARRKKEAFAQQLNKIKVETVVDDHFEADYLNHDLNNLMSVVDQLNRNLEQLRFESEQDHYRVTLVDPASAPKTPSSTKHLKYMAAAPIFAFFLVLGLFLALEIKAGARG